MSLILESGKDILGAMPKFLRDMSEDYPDQALAISKRAQDWSKSIDDEQGINGLGDALLNNAEYVSKAEKEKFENSVAEEMKTFLDTHPEGKIICIVFMKKKGSGPFFYYNITSRLNEELRSRISMWSWVDIREKAVQKPEQNEYYIVDDSSNSGQQLNTMLFSTYIGALSDAAKQMSSNHNFEEREKVKLRVRLMRISKKAREKMEKKYVDKNDISPYCTIDFDENPGANKLVRTTDEVLETLGQTESDLAEPEFLMESHAGRNPTTLAIFSHKVPDNLPLSMVRGGYSQLSKVPPLIEKDEYDTLGGEYQHYSNVLMGAKET